MVRKPFLWLSEWLHLLDSIIYILTFTYWDPNFGLSAMMYFTKKVEWMKE